MIKKWISIVLAAAIFAAADFSCFGALAVPDVSAQSAILLCAENGEVLFEKDAYEQLPMASTTKIMTSLLLCESGRLSETVEVSALAATEGTAMGLRAGDQIEMRSLLYGMLLSSGNDAANAAAIALSGSIAAFAEQMNQRAAEIGMQNTHFTNPSGLPDDNHYSTAYDMAILAREALSNPVFAEVCAAKEAEVYFGNPPTAHTLTYEGCTGIKTGYTKKSGRCLVTAAERNGIHLIAVTLNAPDDWNDHANLFDYGFSRCKALVEPIQTPSAQIPVVGGSVSAVPARGEAKIRTVLTDGKKGGAITVRLYHDPFLYAPVAAGQVVGNAKIYVNGFLLDEIPLTAQADCPVVEDTESVSFVRQMWERIKQFISS